MKNFKFLMFLLPSIALALGGIYMAIFNIGEWGWLIFASLIALRIAKGDNW